MKKITILFVLALVLRILFVWVWYQSGQGHHISLDTTDYVQMAKHLNRGEGFRIGDTPTTRRPPAYAVLIAPFLKYNFFPLGTQILQALLGALSCVLIYAISVQIFDPKTGLLAATLFSLDYMSVRQTVALLPEVVFVFFILASFYGLFKGVKEKSLLWLFLSGIFAGLSVLSKDSLLFYFPILVFWLWLWKGGMKPGLLRGLVFVLGFISVITPWVARNCLLYRKPVLITVSSGHSFYLGNNPSVTGRITGQDWALGEDTVLPEGPNLPPLFTVEADRYFMKKGLEFVQSNPQRFFYLMGRKFINMWRPYRNDSPIAAKILITLTYIPVLTFGLWGVAMTRERWKELFPVLALLFYIVLIHAVTIASVRYRYPAMPFLTMFASYAAVHLWEKRNLLLSKEIGAELRI